jgi:hypothetical protein
LAPACPHIAAAGRHVHEKGSTTMRAKTTVSKPNATDTGWTVTAYLSNSSGSTNYYVTAYVICA